MADSEHEYRKVVRQVAAAREATIVRLIRENEALRAALEGVLQANDQFRAGMPEGWEGDPLQDACDRARAALALKEPGQ